MLKSLILKTAISKYNGLNLFHIIYNGIIIYHFETVPNSMKLQRTIEMWLIENFKIQMA